MFYNLWARSKTNLPVVTEGGWTGLQFQILQMVGLYSESVKMKTKSLISCVVTAHLISAFSHMSRIMRKPDFCICETKPSYAQLVSAFVFASRIVQFLFFLNPKFQAASHLL